MKNNRTNEAEMTTTSKTTPSFQSNQGLQHNGFRYLREQERVRKQK